MQQEYIVMLKLVLEKPPVEGLAAQIADRARRMEGVGHAEVVYAAKASESVTTEPILRHNGG